MQTIKQSGAIVYKFKNGRPQVLVVNAKKSPGNRIFPKGHVEPGETGEQAAERELLEEAGIEGVAVRFLAELSHHIGESRYAVAYYLLRYGSVKGTGEQNRNPTWYPVEEALSLLTFPDSRELLKSAVQFMVEE
jgi:8-oxo-dGTP pyrophosphatase MutT (NUDIX family)